MVYTVCISHSVKLVYEILEQLPNLNLWLTYEQCHEKKVLWTFSTERMPSPLVRPHVQFFGWSFPLTYCLYEHIEGWLQDCSKSDGCFSQYLISSPIMKITTFLSVNNGNLGAIARMSNGTYICIVYKGIKVAPKHGFQKYVWVTTVLRSTLDMCRLAWTIAFQMCYHGSFLMTHCMREQQMY